MNKVPVSSSNLSSVGYDKNELREHFVELPDEEKTDVEAFLGKVFDT